MQNTKLLANFFIIYKMFFLSVRRLNLTSDMVAICILWTLSKWIFVTRIPIRSVSSELEKKQNMSNMYNLHVNYFLSRIITITKKNRVWIFVRRSQRIRNSKRYFWTPSSKETKFQSYANARELTAHVGDLFDLLALINNFHMEGVLTKILAVEEILNFMISSHMFNFQSKHLQLFLNGRLV